MSTYSSEMKNKITLKLYKHIKKHFSEEDTQTDTT